MSRRITSFMNKYSFQCCLIDAASFMNIIPNAIKAFCQNKFKYLLNNKYLKSLYEKCISFSIGKFVRCKRTYVCNKLSKFKS